MQCQLISIGGVINVQSSSSLSVISHSMLLLLIIRIRNPQHKIDDDGQQQDDSEHRRTKAIVEAGLASEPDTFGTPMVRKERIYHGSHRHDGEEEGGDEGGPIAEIQHADGERAEDNGEIEP